MDVNPDPNQQLFPGTNQGPNQQLPPHVNPAPNQQLSPHVSPASNLLLSPRVITPFFALIPPDDTAPQNPDYDAAQNRITSQLATITTAEYHAGIDTLKAIVAEEMVSATQPVNATDYQANQ